MVKMKRIIISVPEDAFEQNVRTYARLRKVSIPEARVAVKRRIEMMVRRDYKV